MRAARQAQSLIATLTLYLGTQNCFFWLEMSVFTRLDGFVPMLHAKFAQPTLAIDMLLLTSNCGRSVCLDRGWHVV